MSDITDCSSPPHREGGSTGSPSPTRDRWRMVGLALYVTVSAGYVLWRATCSMNPEAPIYSWVFLGLEVYAIACSIAFYAVIVRREEPSPRSPTPGRDIDVFICTYNEPVALLRQTARRAIAMRYPHRTWLCDDGRRPEVEALADELGCGYITRPDNRHYKSGNLNSALSRTFGDLVVVLDADHLVRPDFLVRLVGYFDDPHVAVVQTPQVFYNIDSFQHHFSPRKRRLWHEGAIFHHAMQPGANRWNAAFFVGTGAILRRSALEHIGGFATGSITEDAYTCMRLHAAGYRSLYHDEPLAYLLAPESLVQYLTQRLRWGQGSMQILRRENPLFRPGLSWKQRLVYFNALSSFGQAAVHLVYFLAPAVFLLGGPAPLRATELTDFWPLLAHIVIDLIMFRTYLGALGRPLLAESYKFLNVYVFLKALSGYVTSGRLKFQVTTKGRDAGASLRPLAPQIAILLVNITAFGAGVIRIGQEPAGAIGKLGIGVATGFSGLFVVVGAMTVLFARHRIAARAEYTFPDAIPAELEGPGLGRAAATVVRANEVEAHVLVPGIERAPGREDRLSLALSLDDGPLAIEGSVAGAEETDGGVAVHVELDPLSDRARDRLFDRLAERSLPAVVDPLVAPWSGKTAIAGAGDGYYLPLEPKVL